MTRDELIAALEKAEGPSRELDAEVWFATEPRYRDLWQHWTDRERNDMTPRYTASIDAALTLVPDGWNWGITKGADDIGVPLDQSPENFSAGCWPEPFSYQPRVWSKSPALALCIAALKATTPEGQR